MTGRSLTVLAITLSALTWAGASGAQSKTPRGASRSDRQVKQQAKKPKVATRVKRYAARVVDLTRKRAYLKVRGAKARPGDEVLIGKKRYLVEQVATHFVVIELDDTQRLKKGARGFVLIGSQAEVDAKQTLPAPAPLASIRGKWERASPPAWSQSPKPIPLGKRVDERRNRAVLAVLASGVFPQADGRAAVASTRLRARLHLEPSEGLPLSVDVDLQAQRWYSNGSLNERAGRRSRPLLRVRQLQASYGKSTAWFASAGRLRSAALLLGPLDGARAHAPVIEGLTIGAFGGMLADPLNGGVSTDASRFGAELTWQQSDSQLASQASLVAYGSRFAGSMDERRLAGALDVYHQRFSFGGSFEAALYPSNNPWNAQPVELSQGDLHGSYRVGPLELTAELQLDRPERSRYLAAFLPQGWFCQAQPFFGSPLSEPCAASEARYRAAGQGSYRSGPWWARLGASAITDERFAQRHVSSFAGVHWTHPTSNWQAYLDANVAVGDLFETKRLSVGAGAPLLPDILTAMLRYSPSVAVYRADESNFVEHALGVDLDVNPNPALSVTASAELITSRDVKAMVAHGGIVWRPRF